MRIIFLLLVAAVAVFADTVDNVESLPQNDELSNQMEDAKELMADNVNDEESFEDEDKIDDEPELENDSSADETSDDEEMVEDEPEPENDSSADDEADGEEEGKNEEESDAANEKRGYYHQLQRRVIQTKSVLPRGWSVSFLIKPRGVLHGWSAIIHASIGGNGHKYGDRTPGVWFHDWTTRLHICSAVNGNANYCYNQHGQLPKHSFSRITIRQIQKSDSGYLYYYQIFINGKKVVDVLNRRPAAFRNVKYYQASPFFQGANAELRNFHVKTCPHRAFTVLKKNTLVKSIPQLPRGWKVSFQIKPIDVIHGWGNIMHATNHGNVGKYGDRTPGVWFFDWTTRLHICSAINGNANYCYNQKGQLPRNRYSSIVIQQVQYHYHYYFQIFINGKKVFNVINKQAHIFNNVKYFTSDPWYNSALAVIRHFKVQTFPTRYG